VILVSALYTYGQQLPNRYLEETTPTYQVTKDVAFSTNIPTIKTTNLFGNKLANEESYGQVTTTLKMDIYRPTGDNLDKRPVIIFAFGGGFVNGSRTETSMVQLCQNFAKRGFVTATIDYRLGMNISDQQLSKRAVYRAIQDGRSAVRFFRKNAATYGVDPDQIYISGHSAGAFLAYHTVYLDKDSERPASTRLYMSTRADLGGLDAIGDNKTNADGTLVNGKANGVMGFAGALGELSYIENSSEVPAVYFHSSDDNTVPYNSGEPFSSISWLPGFNLPMVYGSNLLNTRAGVVSANHTFYSYTNRGHNVHYSGSTVYSDIAPRGSQFFYDNRLKPNTVVINGSTTVCATCPAQTYSATNAAYYYDWQVVGGTFVNRDPYSNTVSVQWSSTATAKKLTVTPYSRQLARGNATSIDITTNIAPIAKNNLNDIVDFSNVNLNDYFTDPEGEALSYKISTSSNEVAKINDITKTYNNILSIDKLTEQDATITIQVTDGSSCVTTQILKLVNTPKPIFKATVSPNPFAENITIKLVGNYQGAITLELFDDNGRMISTTNANKTASDFNETLNVSNIKPGIYYLKINNGKNQEIKRIVKN